MYTKILTPGIKLYFFKNTKIVRTIIFFLPVFLFSCGGEDKATTEPAQTGTITGVISDAETSLPISYASITTMPPTSAVTTDTLGLYSIENVFPDTFSVIATKSGYRPDSALIAVTAGNVTIGDIHLYTDSTTISTF